jgi:bifunctional DNase/RNase
MSEIEMEFVDIRDVYKGPKVVLKEKSGDRCLNITIRPDEADVIAAKMRGKYVLNQLINKPQTSINFYDFLCTVISNLKAVVQRVIINDIKDNIAYAKVSLVMDGETIEIDCWPIDALNIAIRVGSPIYANETVLEKAGVFYDEKGNTRPVSKWEKQNEQSSNLEMLSESARAVMILAEEDAKAWNENLVHTGSVLIALIKNVSSTASSILQKCGINDIDAINKEINVYIKKHLSTESGETGLTSAVKETLELSVIGAKQLGASKVLPEHILLGLIRQDKGIAANVLKNRGVSEKEVYKQIIVHYPKPWP